MLSVVVLNIVKILVLLAFLIFIIVKFAKSNLSKTRKILSVLSVLLIIWCIFFSVDYILARNQKLPIFCLTPPGSSIQDGGTKEYFGLGYKVISFHKILDSTFENTDYRKKWLL